MLKALFKKQLLELKHLYLMGGQSGKKRSGGQAGMPVVLAVVLLLGSVLAFVGLADGLGSMLIPQGLDWLYFSLFGFMGFLLAVCVGAMSCYSQMFRAKDNELLLSMPIPPRSILLVRIAVAYLVCFVFVAVVWLPAIFESVSISMGIGRGIDAVSLVCALLVWPLLSLLATAFACALGWVIAEVSNRIRHKSIVGAAVIALALVVYLVAYTQFMIGFQEALEQGDFTASAAMVEAVQQWAWPLVQLGLAATGYGSGLLCFAAFAVVLFGAVYAGVVKSFRRIAMGSVSRGRRRAFDVGQLHAHSVEKALLKREASRFVSSAAYLVNCGLGVVFMAILALAAVLNAEVISSVVNELRMQEPWLAQGVPVLLVALVIALVGMDAVTAPSVSLEGKNLWIVRSLPVNVHLLMDAKVRLQMWVGCVPAVVCLAIIGAVFGLDAISLAAALWCVYSFVWFHALFGLAMNLRMPKLSWTNETVPIKQSMPVFLAIVLGWVLAVVMVAVYFVAARAVASWALLLVFAALLTGGAYALSRWVHTSGVRRFEAL